MTMIGQLELLVRRARGWIRRSEWGIRLLQLSKSSEPSTAPGLVLIQIDGLGRAEMERAMAKGRLPFLRRLLRYEGYKLETFYSGLPATTPSVQGEIFYGVRCAVPSFGFRDPESGRIAMMFDSDVASRVEERLAAKGRGLLEGGSAFANIYSGGAAEPHFCAATIGWGELLRAANPLAILGLIALHTPSLFRAVALFFLELGLAFYDFAKGIGAGQSLWEELKFIPRRLAVSIGLREVATIGAEMDVARGLPIIHLNFLGYDEQAHRRGPSSAFAHWTLKGIDHSIRRIWQAAHASHRRDYEVWIYSDHGQFNCQAYEDAHHETIEQAVARVFGSQMHGHEQRRRRSQVERARWLGRPFHHSQFGAPDQTDGNVEVIALGPVGHIYCKDRPVNDEQKRLAKALVCDAHVPLVLVAADPHEAIAFTDDGEYTLPRDAARLLDANHPFFSEVSEELVALCHHSAAGDFVICGWRRDEPMISFGYENGAHAGPAVAETRAFAIVPEDAPLAPGKERNFIRGLDLREAAMSHLKRSPTPVRRRRPNRPSETLRILTYNVHSCVGMDGRMSPERIARVIGRYAPDIVALQELDVRRNRTGGIDQAHAIAHELEMDFHFHPSLRVEEEQYGNAVLSRFPMRLARADALPTLGGHRYIEPRGALWVTVDVQGQAIQLINTHLGLNRRERLLQAEALVGPEWLGHPDCAQPVIVCGDFNDHPSSLPCRRLRALLYDAQLAMNNHRPRGTWLGRYPFRRLDYVFIGRRIKVTFVDVPRTELTRTASDHLPLVVDLCLS